MTRQRARYLRRAIPRLAAKPVPTWIITGPRLSEHDLARIRRRFTALHEGRHSPSLMTNSTAEYTPAGPIGWPEHWMTAKPAKRRCHWRRLFGLA